MNQTKNTAACVVHVAIALQSDIKNKNWQAAHMDIKMLQDYLKDLKKVVKAKNARG